MEKQERYDRAYMRMAQEWAKLSYSQRKQVGAIIVKDRMIISDGYNGTPTGFDDCCEDAQGDTLWYVLKQMPFSRWRLPPSLALERRSISPCRLVGNVANSYTKLALSVWCTRIPIEIPAG